MDELSPAASIPPFPFRSPPLDMNPRCTNAWSQIVRGHGHGYGDGESSFQFHAQTLRAETERQSLQAEECRSRQRVLGDGGDGLTASQKPCEPLCAEKGKQIVHEEESRLPQKQHGDGEGNTASQKPDDPLCVEKEKEAEECRQKEQHGYGYSDGDGDGETAPQKGKPSGNAEESQNQQKPGVELHCGQADITQAIVAEPEKKQVSNSIAQRPQTVNGLLDDASAFSSKSKEGESMATPPKPAWRTLEAESRVSLESGFVMEAASWPTLAEARNTKPSEARKSASSKEAASAPSQPSGKVSTSQGPSTETLRHSSAHVKGNPSLSGSGAKYKSPFKQGNITGNGKPSFPASENIPSSRMWHHVPGANVLLPDQSRKSYGLIGMKGFPAAPHQAPGHGSFRYRREEAMAPIPNNSANWHNNMRAYGRGHPGWHHHGRGHDKHAGFLPPHEQHIGPRNVHPPLTPFMNINPAYYNIPNYQRGNMYYMPPAAPDFNHNHTYFGPSGPPEGVMHGPDLMRIRAMLQKQIEYYFSTQNLCKDMYLRSRMDDEGFVPVSLIASFKRVQVLTSSPMLILEALQMSSVVEVKGDRIRRSHDWRRWLMPKPSSSSSSQACCIENVNSFVPTNNTRTDRVNGQVNYILEKSGEHCFDGSSMLQEIRLEDGTSTGTSYGQKSGDTCSSHGTETKDRIDGDISSVSSTGELNSVTSTEEQLGWNCFDHSGTYQESSISHGPFGNGDDDAGISEGFINAGGDSFPASVLLQYVPSSIGKNGTACEQVISSNSIPQREITMDSDILAEETKQKDFSCSTNSFLSDEDSCPSFAEPVYLSKSHNNNEDRVEVNDRRLITVTHAQLSSCIAVP